MEEIVSNLTSVSWWFSVVVAGLIVSVIGAYAKSALGREGRGSGKRVGPS